MSTKAKTENVKKEEKLPVVVYQAVGKRKESSARVKLTLAEEVTIAGVKVKKGYFVYDQGVAGSYFVKRANGREYNGKVWPGWCAFPDFTMPELLRQEMMVFL